MQFITGLLTKFVDANKLGGWIRAFAASTVFPALIAKYPLAGVIIDPGTQTLIAGAVSGLVVGAWSHYVKT